MRRSLIPGRSRSLITTGLLGLAVIATGALTWETIRSTRSARETAGAVLSDYSTFAAWQFARAAETRLNTTLNRVLDRTRHDLRGHVHPPAQPGADDCDCAGGPTTSTRFVIEADGSTQVIGEPLPAAARDAAVAARGHAGPRSPAHLAIVDTPDGRRAVVLLASLANGPRVVGAVLAPDALADILRDVFSTTPLLPQALIGQTPSAELFSLQVADAVGVPVFNNGTRSRHAGTAELPAPLAGLRVEVSVHPERASSLVIGGLPAARWPVALGLLALSTGLVVLGLVQMRREVRFARRQADFVSGVSHELRTPLAQIRLYGETLLLGRVRSPGEGRRAAEIIVQEARRLGALVDTVLLFSRISRQRVAIRREAVDASALAGEVIETFRPFAMARESTVVLDAQRAAGPVAIDRDACRQILLNLLDNAVKFGPTGQTVRVTLEALPQRLAIAVDDEGPGVSREHATRIWEAFWRVPGSAEGGSGLGLSIVRELARRHGGDATLEPRPGRGARFVVTLETRQAPATARAGATVPA